MFYTRLGKLLKCSDKCLSKNYFLKDTRNIHVLSRVQQITDPEIASEQVTDAEIGVEQVTDPDIATKQVTDSEIASLQDKGNASSNICCWISEVCLTASKRHKFSVVRNNN